MTFPTTNWTLLAHATLSGDTAGMRALGALLNDYRQPVVSFLVQRGSLTQDAEDLTHQLFADMMSSRAWRQADRSRGRFRSFLLGILAHVISREQRRETAQKRGGQELKLSLEELADRGVEMSDPAPQDAAFFDRQWALNLVNGALTTVQDRYAADGRSRQWEVLLRYLPGAGETPTYEASAAELGLSLSALKTAVHRVRNEFREALRRAVSCTVGAAHEVEDELAYLHRVLSSPSM